MVHLNWSENGVKRICTLIDLVLTCLRDLEKTPTRQVFFFSVFWIFDFATSSTSYGAHLKLKLKQKNFVLKKSLSQRNKFVFHVIVAKFNAPESASFRQPNLVNSSWTENSDFTSLAMISVIALASRSLEIPKQ